MEEKLLNFLKMNEVEYKENLWLKNYSSVKIGGMASLVLFPDTVEKIITAIDFLVENKIDYKIIGRLTNILIEDKAFDTVFLKTDNLKGVIMLEDGIRLFAGEKLSVLSYLLAKEGIGGFSALSGIPGSIGGNVRNNAGAFGVEISDILRSVTVYSPIEKRILKLSFEDAEFGYRKSVFSSLPMIILYADFHIAYDSPERIREHILEVKQRRIKTQPLEFLSLGSVFKRPKGDYAARLIDAANLKGYAIGGAEVSSKHAGFIVNKGNATFEDFLSLIEYTKSIVFQKYGILLEEEIEIYKGK